MSNQIIVPQDPSAATMKVSTFDRKVIQHFPHPLEWIALEGEEAIALGMCLMDRAYEARPDLKPVDNNKKHEFIERHRKTLTRRLEVILNSTREKKTTSNAKLAKELVEVMLREVFQ